MSELLFAAAGRMLLVGESEFVEIRRTLPRSCDPSFERGALGGGGDDVSGFSGAGFNFPDGFPVCLLAGLQSHPFRWRGTGGVQQPEPRGRTVSELRSSSSFVGGRAKGPRYMG